MELGYTTAQLNRLAELGLDEAAMEQTFSTPEERLATFQQIEKEWNQKNKDILSNLVNHTHRPALCRLSEDLAQALCGHGFTQVVTPTIVSAKALGNMTITPSEPLYQQVFWLDGKSALRPMLAPNLYEVSRQLMGSQKLPLKIFEIGSCFRKESEGKSHLKEFTMLNLVEWGTPEERRVEALKEYASIVLEAAGLTDYSFVEEESTVYGTGLDVVSSDGLELASTSMGPHPLDDAWKINCTWVGVGFGLERILKYREKKQGIRAYSRSNVFLDGACLKVR